MNAYVGNFRQKFCRLLYLDVSSIFQFSDKLVQFPFIKAILIDNKNKNDVYDGKRVNCLI